MSSSKIIKKEDSRFETWEVPSVEGSDNAVLDGSGMGLVTAKQLEKIQESAYNEAREQGFSKGFDEGMKAGQVKITEQQKVLQEKIIVLEKLFSQLRDPFEELDRKVEQELVYLAIGIARQIIRRELKIDPGQIVAVVKETLSSLPSHAQSGRLYLHPDDVEIIREIIFQSKENDKWTLQADPIIERGGCKVETDNSQINATIDNRLATIFLRVVGGEREGDLNDT